MSTRSGTARHRERSEIVIVVAVSVLAVALLYARLPFAARQFWAEDGRAFFGDAMRFGPIKAFGHSEAGYYLTIPRIGGAIASLVPLRDAALAMWWSVAAVTAWMVATVTVASRTWLECWPSRITFALALVLIPVVGFESIGNVANLQFSLLVVAFVVLVGDARHRWETVNGAAVILATGLTTPLAVLLVPFVVFRAARRRSWRPDTYVVAWAVGVGAQWIAIAVTRPDAARRSADTATGLLQRLEVFGVERNFLPRSPDGYRGPIFVIVFIALALAVVVLAWHQGERARALLLALVPAYGISMIFVLGLSAGGANRYLVVTGLCLVWTALAGAETVGVALQRVVPNGRLIASVLVSGWLLVTFALNGEPSELRQSGPTWHEALAEARAVCADRPTGAVRVHTAPLQPEKPDQWTVLIRCADLD